MNQKGIAELGAILLLLAIGAAIGVVNHPPKTVEKERIVEVEKPVVVEVVKEVRVECEKSWYQFWK